MNKEEILSKHTGVEGIYLTKGMIRGSDALEAMEEYAASQPSNAPRWVKAFERSPESADSYHVKVFEKEGDGYTFPAVLCYTMGAWEVMEENQEVIEWLEE